jgi:hypothetical protein
MAVFRSVYHEDHDGQLHPYPLNARTGECQVELEFLAPVARRIDCAERMMVHHLHQVGGRSAATVVAR